MSFVSLQLTCRVHLLVTGHGTAPLCVRNQSDGPEIKVGPSVAWSKYFQTIIIITFIDWYRVCAIYIVLFVYFIGLPAVRL